MKILHVLSHSIPHTDGYCIRSANIVKFQKSQGWDPIVVTSPRQEPVPKQAVETIDGIQYFRTLPKDTLVPLLRGPQAIRQTQLHIEEIIRREKPEVIHAHSPCTWAYAAAKAAKRCQLPFVYEVRWIWEDGAVDQGRLTTKSLKYRLSRLFETHLARRSNALVTISDHLEKEFRGRGVKNVFVVPNGVDLIRFNAEHANDTPGNSGITTIGYIGSLYAWEGVEDLVHAASNICRADPEVRVKIVGGGETEQGLRNLIESLSLTEHVEMVGRVPHDQIGIAYNDIDILVYPRRSSRTTELVTPLKPLEAMAQKKAIIISDVGGLTELVSENGAARFKAGDSDDLARVCLQLIRDKISRTKLSEDAYHHVHSHRNWVNIIESYNAVYEHASSMAGR